jgi:hypothetical protein
MPKIEARCSKNAKNRGAQFKAKKYPKAIYWSKFATIVPPVSAKLYRIPTGNFDWQMLMLFMTTFIIGIVPPLVSIGVYYLPYCGFRTDMLSLYSAIFLNLSMRPIPFRLS